jgi:hypothetical protein
MFVEEVDLSRSAAQMPLLKIGSGVVTRCRLESEEFLWLGTHWILGRQWVCAKTADESCLGCSVQLPRIVGMAVVSVDVASHRRPFLFEVGAGAFSRLRGLCLMEGWEVSAGLHFTARRRSGRSPLTLTPECFEEDLASTVFSSQLRLISAIAVLYRLPLPLPNERAQDWAVRVRPAAASMLGGAVARASS